MSGIRRKNIQDQKFGRLTVLEYVRTTSYGQTYWLCQCDCGATKEVRSSHLLSGDVQSCGCLVKETSSITAKKYLAGKYVETHGGTGSRLFSIWMAMRVRCRNKKAISYHNYGGRGITVCVEWDNDFSVFRDWALKNGYSDNLTIDRIDNDKGYSPENCKWSTKVEQGNNRRTCHYITYKNETKTVIEWERYLGFPKNLLSHRLLRGWSTERAIETPIRSYK